MTRQPGVVELRAHRAAGVQLASQYREKGQRTHNACIGTTHGGSFLGWQTRCDRYNLTVECIPTVLVEYRSLGPPGFNNSHYVRNHHDDPLRPHAQADVAVGSDAFRFGVASVGCRWPSLARCSARRSISRTAAQSGDTARNGCRARPAAATVSSSGSQPASSMRTFQEAIACQRQPIGDLPGHRGVGRAIDHHVDRRSPLGQE